MLKCIFYPRVSMAPALLMLTMLAAPLALAVTFIVNDSTVDLPDTNPASGTCHTTANTCTLRAAVMQANRASAPSATIMVPAGIYNLTIPAITGADGDDNGDLNLTAPSNGFTTITIIGAGAGTTIIDANQNDRVFHVHANRTATISGVTIRNGFLSGANSGGGIYNEGSLTVSNATISGNNAQNGGGIMNYYLGTAFIINSTLSQNNATYGGGGIANYGSLFMVNSTVALNEANNSGGGIDNEAGAANIYNATIVFNVADADADGGASGGGVFNDDAGGATFNLRNTLVAGNVFDGILRFDNDCAGTLTVYGRELFGDVTGCTINFGSGGAYALYGSLNTIGPLQNNGGPTSTHALLSGSKAIDFGDPVQGCVDNNSVTIPTDQRGFPRAVGVRCDVGAFEYSALSPPVLVSAVSRKVHGGAGTFNLPLGSVATNPTTEPRQGPAQMIVFTFDKAINAATVTISEGIATAGAATFSGNDVNVGLTGVNNQQYVTVALTNVASSDGSSGGAGSVRVGYLAGDVNQNRVVTVADLGLVNAQLAQTVTAANYLKDVNASGTLTVGDKGITNANLTKALPAP